MFLCNIRYIVRSRDARFSMISGSETLRLRIRVGDASGLRREHPKDVARTIAILQRRIGWIRDQMCSTLLIMKSPTRSLITVTRESLIVDIEFLPYGATTPIHKKPRVRCHCLYFSNRSSQVS